MSEDFSCGDIVILKLKGKKEFAVHRLNFKNKPYCQGKRISKINIKEFIDWLEND